MILGWEGYNMALGVLLGWLEDLARVLDGEGVGTQYSSTASCYSTLFPDFASCVTA